MSNILTPVFRVSYPNVFNAKVNDLNGKEEFSLVALFAKGADLSKLKNAAQEAIVAKFGADQKKWPKNMRSPFRKHEEKLYENESGQMVYPNGMEEGGIFMNLKSTQKPGVVNEQVEDIIDASDFYAGCFARATVSAYAYDFKGNAGVSFGLRNIQKVKDGDVFGSKTKPQDDFAPIEGATPTAASAPKNGDAAGMFD